MDGGEEWTEEEAMEEGRTWKEPEKDGEDIEVDVLRDKGRRSKRRESKKKKGAVEEEKDRWICKRRLFFCLVCHEIIQQVSPRQQPVFLQFSSSPPALFHPISLSFTQCFNLPHSFFSVSHSCISLCFILSFAIFVPLFRL